ncbi:hypothetical protein JCM8547_002788 [Rhodosporidiobolus lusitaniae]
MAESSHANTRFSVSVLTTHTVDSQPSLLVTFDDQRYLFNTPEAISRVALQSKVGLRKVNNVFLGELEQSAGLPGFILSSVEAGNDKIQVVGPEGTDHLLASCRFFTRRDRLSLKVTSPASLLPAEASTSPSLPPAIHSDANLSVHAFVLSPSDEPAPVEPMAVDATPAATNGSTAASTSPSLKRKRSANSPSPPPRSKSPPGESSHSSFDPSSPSFNSAHLRGEDASTWRNLVVRDMFRGEAFEPRPPARATSPSGRRVSTPAYLPQSLPTLGRDFTPTALSYLAIGPRKRGKFLPEKAKALGVKPGKAFSRLIAGGRVWIPAVSAVVENGAKGGEGEGEGEKKKETKKERQERMKREKEAEEKALDEMKGKGEGKWVEATDCMDAGQDATAFLVLNVPSPAHLPSLVSSLPPARLQPTCLPEQTAFRAVFLFLGPSVLSSPSFQSYFSSLSSALPGVTFHVSSADFVVQGKNEVNFAPSALLNLRLSQLDSEMFQLPRYSFLPSPSSLPGLPTSLLPLQPNSHFTHTLDPSDKSPFGSPIRSFDFPVPSAQADLEAARLKGHEKPAEVLERAAAAWEEYCHKAGEAKKVVEAEEKEREEERKKLQGVEKVEGELVVTPLGTGSAIPSKYRNVSSTLLHLPRSVSKDEKQEYILLDAGEGTWGQIARRFGEGNQEKGEPSKDDVLRGIKMLFISHLHQDHHAGMARILRERVKLNPPPSDPLTIVCPPNARVYLFEQQQLFDLGLYERGGRGVRFVENQLVEPGKTLNVGSPAAKALDDLKNRLGLNEVTAVPVLHRCRAWGVVIGHSSGWKVVFSGDTMPCQALADAGKGASLLVHEATIEDDMPEVAEAKGHSTFAQAIEVATMMQARHLLLTHFSARYPKLPPLTSSFTSSSSSSSSSPDAPRPPVIATAFDLMTLPLRDFWKVARYRDAMDALLSWDEADEVEEAEGEVKGEGEGGEDGDELSGKEKSVSAGAAEGEGQGDGKEVGRKKSKRQEKKAKFAAEKEKVQEEGKVMVQA